VTALRGALLGAGNIALRGHGPQWATPELRERAPIVAIADLSPSNREQIQALFPDARLYEDARELLARETLDFVDICTPPFTHRALVEEAAGRGVHVICEKPLALKLEDGLALAAAVRRAGVVFQPCHQYHYSPQWLAVRGFLPRIGRVYWASWEVQRMEANDGNANWNPAWRTDPALAGGGIVLDHGVHISYQLRAALGEPLSVQASVRTLRHSYGVEDSAFMTLEYERAVAQVRLTWAARHREVRFHFIGETGEIVGDDHSVVVNAGGVREEAAFGEGISGNSSHSEWYGPLFREFLRRVEVREPSSEGLEEALYTMRLVARTYEASRSGAKVSFRGPEEAVA
jgi:predicted dehydrogenase